MMVSTKGRYALRVLIDLAEHQTDGYIPLKDTAARQEISEKYLEGIIKILVKAAPTVPEWEAVKLSRSGRVSTKSSTNTWTASPSPTSCRMVSPEMTM